MNDAKGNEPMPLDEWLAGRGARPWLDALTAWCRANPGEALGTVDVGADTVTVTDPAAMQLLWEDWLSTAGSVTGRGWCTGSGLVMPRGFAAYLARRDWLRGRGWDSLDALPARRVLRRADSLRHPVAVLKPEDGVFAAECYGEFTQAADWLRLLGFDPVVELRDGRVRVVHDVLACRRRYVGTPV